MSMTHPLHHDATLPCAGHANQGRGDPDHPRLRPDRHPRALPLRRGPRLPQHAGGHRH